MLAPLLNLLFPLFALMGFLSLIIGFIFYIVSKKENSSKRRKQSMLLLVAGVCCIFVVIAAISMLKLGMVIK